MGQDEYSRLKDILKIVAEKQERLAYNMPNAERRFSRTEKAIASLLNTIKKRIGGK
jgi:hypothetical protein